MALARDFGMAMQCLVLVSAPTGDISEVFWVMHERRNSSLICDTSELYFCPSLQPCLGLGF